ncbi:MAG: GNAT family N-acetyltransferase [Hyphomicrobiaceae bacterium]|nr:GNAT family N-acetyltransferase [Hyphomicrobiaceae bacterium]
MTVRRHGIASKFNPIRSIRPSGGMLPFRARLPRPPIVGRRVPHKVYGRIGNLEVRLARSKGELKRAQRLRYHVFYEEMSAIADPLVMMSRRDEDAFDAICDHLLVVDLGAEEKGRRPWRRRARVVGTYRILRQDVAELHDGFYTQGEYNIAPMLDALGPDTRFMELGRSCVLKSYRNRRTLELLWQGIWNYAREHRVDAMLGCASFEGTDPRRHAEALSYLHHHALAPEQWRARAHDDIYVGMNMLPESEINTRAVIRSLPPLIKGYLRVGSYVGDGAVIDHQFGTTDVFVILPIEAINERYFAHFGAPDEYEQTVPSFTPQLN